MKDCDEIRENFAQGLKKLRKAEGVTQEELAQKLGVGKNSILGYELGKNSPSFERAVLIAEHFNVPLDFFAKERKNVAITAFVPGDDIFILDRINRTYDKGKIQKLEIYETHSLVVCNMIDRTVRVIDSGLYKEDFFLNEDEAILAAYRLVNQMKRGA